MASRTARGSKANADRAEANRNEYAAHWSRRSAREAALHFGVHVRTIQQWRTRLGLARPTEAQIEARIRAELEAAAAEVETDPGALAKIQDKIRSSRETP